MNLVLGVAPPGGAEGLVTDSLADIAVSHRTPEGRSDILASSDSIVMCALSDGGKVVGKAQSDGVALAYIGAIHEPLEGWREPVNPIEDPDLVARFLLRSYLVGGVSNMATLAGCYALAIFDHRIEKLILITDPYGGRTWFVHEAGYGIHFSSNLYALSKTLGPSLRLDRSMEDFFLIYGFYPFGRTPFSGVRSLNAGEVLEWQSGKTTSYCLDPPSLWRDEIADPLPENASESAVITRLHDALFRAVKEQSPSSPAEVGVLLGGFDSALVASFLHRIGHRVTTFSFRYEESRFNQPHTDDLSKFLGTRHKWIQIDRSVIERGLSNFAQIFNQPTNWPNYVIQTAEVCAQMRIAGISYCYSGDGCDGVFLGYPGTYLRARVFDRLPMLPAWMMEAIVGLAAWPFLERKFGHPYRVLLGLLRGTGRSRQIRTYLSFRVMDEMSLSSIRGAKVPIRETELMKIADEVTRPYADLPVLRKAYQGKAAVSPNRNKLIGSSDLAGMPILSPYMHPAVKRLALGLPDGLLRPERQERGKDLGKYILMKMAEAYRLLPESVIYQRKMAAVDAPIDDWYAGPLREFMLRQMSLLPFDFERDYVNALLDKKWTETVAKRYVLSDKVVSHAPSLLATYASFSGLTQSDSC